MRSARTSARTGSANEPIGLSRRRRHDRARLLRLHRRDHANLLFVGAPPAETPAGDTPGGTDKETPAEPAAPTAPNGIGNWEDRGLAIVEGDTQARSTCKEVCSKKGGSCTLALDSVQGGGGPVAGIANYVFVQPGQPAGFIPYDLATCASSVDATKEASNDTGSLEKYECACDGVPVPTRAIVKATEGVHACRDVCQSWAKSCSNARTWEDGTKGGALAFYGSGTKVKAFNCATAPDKDLEVSALDGYWCACE